MMEEIKPKKERKFLKAMGDIALTLFRELVLGIGKKVINKVGNKQQGLVITFIILASTFAIAQFPNTGNKQRLGFQTTGDGLTWRGSISDTASIQPINNQNAWVILDTVNLKMYSFDFTSNVWNLVGGAQGLTMPFDSITFNTAKNGTVGVGEVEYNDTQGSLIQGLKGGNVTNVIGQQLHQRVNNRTGAPLAKGDVVYLAGSQGNRITVAKGLAVTDAFSANTFGVVAESIADNASGFIITEGLITGLNTSALTEDSAVYLSPTIAGALTSTKPQAPQHSVYIGVCVKSNNGSGELFVKIRNGQELDELHDVRISNPINNASLYYKLSEKLWRDTTAALLVSDTASMLTPYFRDADTTSLNLTSRFAAKLNLSDTASMLTNYLRTGVAASTYLPLTGGTLTGTINRQEGSHNGSASTFYYNILNYFARQDNIKYNPTAQITFTDRPGTLTFENVVRTSDIHLMTARSFNGTSLGQYLDTTLSVVANQDGGRIGISKLNPEYKLDVNGTFNASGNSLIGGTLSVTGATTLTGGINGNIKTNGVQGATATPDNIWLGNSYSNGTTRDKLKIYLYNDGTEKYGFTVGGSSDIQYHSNIFHDFYISNTKKFLISNTNTTTDNIFTVNNAAVFNEGAADADFRVESIGNNNMVFVDASTDRVGIGYASPTKTLDVNGEVRINTLTATPTSLLGKDGSNVVGNVRLTSPLSLAGDSLNLGTVPISKGGTGADNASLARTLLSVGYNFVQVTAGSSVTITSNRVSVVNTGGFSTTQLDLTPATNGRMYMIKNLASGTVVSLHSNVIPLTGGSPTTAILSAGNATPQWVTLVADGTNWHVMQSN